MGIPIGGEGEEEGEKMIIKAPWRRKPCVTLHQVSELLMANRRNGLAAALLVGAVIALASRARAADESDTQTFKKVGERELKVRILKPTDAKPGDSRPAIVLFHGGGWVGGLPHQFDEQARYLITRGIVCIQPAYRLLSREDTKQPPDICIHDAKSAMRWVRSHAKELGIDPNRVAAGGGSAGGHLAAFVGLADGIDDPQDDKTVSAKANALVLFNPVFDNGPEGGWGIARVGDRFKELSPAHNISSGDPPTAIFMGRNDRLIPTATVERFAANMKQAGVRCDLHIYDEQGHGFFNSDPYRTITLVEADKFLTSLGYLIGEPTIQAPPLPAAGEPSPDAAKQKKKAKKSE
jgi:acetyl esterase/lipase